MIISLSALTQIEKAILPLVTSYQDKINLILGVPVLKMLNISALGLVLLLNVMKVLVKRSLYILVELVFILNQY